MEKINVQQEYDSYTAEDHATWGTLFMRQASYRQQRVSREYLEGLSKLMLDEKRVVNIGEASKHVESISGWTLIPVKGLIPTKEFFYMLINKQYPVTIYMRKPHEIDFSEQPDIFHDVCGHLPLLTNEKFVKFLTAYSTIALKYVNNEKAIELLGRLYWYTYEMGVIREDGGYKPYGGALITSAHEIANMESSGVPKYAFDLDGIFRTPYDSFRLQKEYFVIESFDDLFASIDGLERTLIEHLLLPATDITLRNYSLNPRIGKGFNNVIGFLNDTQYKFPQAISFVAGQPDEQFFNIGEHMSKFGTYIDHMAGKWGCTRERATEKIGQYGKTKGIINDILAEYLKNDEHISIHPEQILVTTGAQEAFSIVVSTICDRERDVILVEDPGYIGVSSFARVFNYDIEGVPTDEEGIDLIALKRRIIDIHRTGRRVKLLYLIPDYQNPSGACMPAGNRLKVLEMAQKYNFLVMEDSVYNSFTYAQKKNPTIKSLDRYGRVIYIGSFSKSLFPGLRIGLIATDQMIENEEGEVVPLVDEMVKVKAQLTNNTSAISQAVLGVLLDLNYSLSELNRLKFERYKRKRDKMIACLNEHIGRYTGGWAQGIRWNEPDGGFFIKMTLPFPINEQSVTTCADKYKVIFCPMRFFYLGQGGENELRLTFSNLTLDDIETGISRLAEFLKAESSHGPGPGYEHAGVAPESEYNRILV